ncbi:MAG: glycosyltransferase [Acidobacteriota bacterium]
MKVALVGPTYPFRGGIAHYTTLLDAALRSQHDVHFVSFKRQYPDFLFPGKSDRDPSDEPMRSEHAHFLLDSLNPLSWRRSARSLVAFEPELVIFQWWVAFWAPHFWSIARYVRRRRPQCRIVFLCHNAVEHESNRLKIAATRIVLRTAHEIFTHARAETGRLVSLLGPNVKVSTAFHPTYAELGEQAVSRHGARRKLGVSGPTLLFFGFVRPYKGLAELLEAVPAILAERPVTLLVVGEFWRDKATYEDTIARLGIGEHVRVVDGYVPNEDIATWFAAADLVVQPYRSASGSGISQLAYGHRRPVIATRVGSLAEVVEDGQNGRLVPPRDPSALASAILDSLDPPTLERMTAQAAKTRDRFSWPRLVEILTGQDAGQS